MRQNGYSTFWLGKNHNVPVDDLAQGGTKETWPLHQGWDSFYGFLGGETNNWYPDLVHDNHYIEQPYSPEEGYHLSKDLADQAITDDPRRQGQRAVTAVADLVLPRCATMRRTMPRRSTSTSTRASSTTATRPIASGSCRG